MKEVIPQRVHAVRIHLYIVVQKQKMHLHYIKSQRAVDLCYVTACMGILVTLLLYLDAGYMHVCSVFEVTQLYSYDLCTLLYIFYSSMKSSKVIKKPGPMYFWKIFSAFIFFFLFLFFLIAYFFFFFLVHLFLFIYLFLAVWGPRFCVRAFSSCGKWGPLFIAVRGPLTIAAPPAAEHRLQMRRLSNCGSRVQPLRGMWDLPRPGLEPVFPALAGRFPTTAPPGKPFSAFISLVCRSTRRFQTEKEKRKHLEPQSSKHNHHNTNFLFFFGTGFLIES